MRKQNFDTRQYIMVKKLTKLNYNSCGLNIIDAKVFYTKMLLIISFVRAVTDGMLSSQKKFDYYILHNIITMLIAYYMNFVTLCYLLLSI